MDLKSARSEADPGHPTQYQHALLEITGPLRNRVKALVGIEISRTGPIPMAVAPHDSLTLSVNLGRGSDPVERKHKLGRNMSLTGIRDATGNFSGAGDCVTLFALLTPLGAVELLESQTLGETPRIKASVADLLGDDFSTQLESDVAAAKTLHTKLLCMASWLEARATARRRQSIAAIRAARAATRICQDSHITIDELTRDLRISRRQMERDFRHWLGTSPTHLKQVVRLQQVSRHARRERSLATVAADIGFADQAHMSRVVKTLTGLTPRGFLASNRTPVAQVFRVATGGTTVYL